jgi:hypothetical protein
VVDLWGTNPVAARTRIGLLNIGENKWEDQYKKEKLATQQATSL